MKNTILLLAFITCSLTGRAQAGAETPEAILETFFNTYTKSGIKPAVEKIYTYGDESMQQSLKYVEDTIAHTIEQIGSKYLGHELITKKIISPCLCLYTYLLKFPYAPLRFTFVFYKPDNKWVIENFLFDGSIISDMIRASKTEYQK